MSTPAHADPLAKLLTDLKIHPNGIEKTMDGIRARIVYCELDLVLEISRNPDQQWRVALNGKFLNEIQIRVVSNSGSRQQIRELFLDTLGQYMVRYQQMLMKATTVGNSLKDMVEDMLGDNPGAVYI